MELNNGDYLQLVLIPIIYHWTLLGALHLGTYLEGRSESLPDAKGIFDSLPSLAVINIGFSIALSIYFGWIFTAGIGIFYMVSSWYGSIWLQSQVLREFVFLHWLRNYKLVAISLGLILTYNILAYLGYTMLIFHSVVIY